jgi:hypothetical protein
LVERRRRAADEIAAPLSPWPDTLRAAVAGGRPASEDWLFSQWLPERGLRVSTWATLRLLLESF